MLWEIQFWLQRVGNDECLIQVPSLPSRWQSESDIKNIIWQGNANNFMLSLEGHFSMPCMSSVKFYMPVSQRHNNLDLTTCTGQKADSRGRRGPPGRAYILTYFMMWKKNAGAPPNKRRCISVMSDCACGYRRFAYAHKMRYIFRSLC